MGSGGVTSFLIQLIPILFLIPMSLQTKSKYMNIWMLIANLVSILITYTLGLSDASFAQVVIISRSIIVIYKDKFKTNTVCYVLLSIQIVLGVLAYINIFSILAILAPCIVTYCCWFKDVRGIRGGSIFSNVLWVIYSLGNNAYGLVFYYILSTVVQSVTALRVEIRVKKAKVVNFS